MLLSVFFLSFLVGGKNSRSMLYNDADCDVYIIFCLIGSKVNFDSFVAPVKAVKQISKNSLGFLMNGLEGALKSFIYTCPMFIAVGTSIYKKAWLVQVNINIIL